MRQKRFEMHGYNRKLCRTHLVGDIENWKPSCYILICHRCGYDEGIGSWYEQMWKDGGGRYKWSKKQWPFIFAAIQMLEMGRRVNLTKAYFKQYWTDKEYKQSMDEVKEYWHKWIEENIKMSEWIECNLPWNVYIWENREEFNDQNLDIKEELDVVYKKHFAELEQVRQDIIDVMELDISKNEYGFIDFDKWDKHPLRYYLGEINETLREIHLDLNDESIYKELDKRTALYEEKRKQLSFCGRGLNKAGTLIEINGKQILIGHINELNVDAGCCGGSAFEDKDVVTRYKVLSL